MSEELKPCPFCGKPAHFRSMPGIGLVRVSCNICAASSDFYQNNDYPAATRYWNTRPIEDALRGDVARLTAELKAAREAMRWIPVGERLPEEDQEVICMTTRKNQHTRCIRTFFSDGEFCTPWTSDIVTHWMPLPPEPRK